MRPVTKTAFLLCAVCILVCGAITPVRGASLFSGLILSRAEGGGVRVVEIYPGSPAAKAGLKIGDVVTELDRKRIKKLGDFVEISRSLDKSLPEVEIRIIRDGGTHDYVIASYSAPVYKSWRVKVVEPPYSALGGVSLIQYWLEKGKRKLMESRGNVPVSSKVADYREAIKYFFFALHYAPSSVDAGLMVADTYKGLGELYLSEGSLPDALESYAEAAQFYSRTGDKATREKDLKRVLGGLQEVEERLFMLLPQEKG